MAQDGKRSSKEQQVDTDGGAYIGNDVNAGRDFVGRDYNVTNHIHNHNPARRKSGRSSRQGSDVLTIEAELTDTVIKLFHSWFSYIVVLFFIQLLCIPFILTVTDLLPVLILPAILLVAILYFIRKKAEHLLRIAGFYDKLSVDKRTQVKYDLGQKQWGSWWLNWYTFLLLALCVQIDKRRLKKR